MWVFICVFVCTIKNFQYCNSNGASDAIMANIIHRPVDCGCLCGKRVWSANEMWPIWVLWYAACWLYMWLHFQNQLAFPTRIGNKFLKHNAQWGIPGIIPKALAAFHASCSSLFVALTHLYDGGEYWIWMDVEVCHKSYMNIRSEDHNIRLYSILKLNSFITFTTQRKTMLWIGRAWSNLFSRCCTWFSLTF